jgi:hypothetical protein
MKEKRKELGSYISFKVMLPVTRDLPLNLPWRDIPLPPNNAKPGLKTLTQRPLENIPGSNYSNRQLLLKNFPLTDFLELCDSLRLSLPTLSLFTAVRSTLL